MNKELCFISENEIGSRAKNGTKFDFRSRIKQIKETA